MLFVLTTQSQLRTTVGLCRLAVRISCPVLWLDGIWLWLCISSFVYMTTPRESGTPASGTFYDAGSTNTICTATDPSGNQNQCFFAVQVTDAEPPEIVCPSSISETTEPGLAVRSVSFPDPVVSDNVETTNATCTTASGSVFQVRDCLSCATASPVMGDVDIVFLPGISTWATHWCLCLTISPSPLCLSTRSMCPTP